MSQHAHILQDDNKHVVRSAPSLQPDIPPQNIFRILVVDDSDADRAAICRALSVEKNFEIHMASSADGLMTMLADHEFDCVTLDQLVGTDTAFAIIERIKKARLDPPAVIMLTGAGNERTAVNAFRCGFSDYVRKCPSSSQELLGRISRAVRIKRDQKRQNEVIERLTLLARRDNLTGLPNRHELEERLSIILESGTRYGKTFAVIILDINQFKKINDSFGHSVGDLALKAFANQLAKTARCSDTIGRFGGDEFLYLIENAVSIESITNSCRRLSAALSFSVELQNVGLSIRPSIGAAIYPIDGKTIADLLEAADQAMYEAKASASGYCLAFERKHAGRAAPDIGAHAVVDVKPLPSSTASGEPSAAASDAPSDSPTVAGQFPSAPTESRVDPPHLASAPSNSAGMRAPDGVYRYADRRIEPRHRVFKRGVIVINDGFSTIDCMVRDLSTRGARIRISAPVDVALNRFSLTFAETGKKFSAEKRWQSGQDIGLRFLDHVGRPMNTEAKTPEESPMKAAPEQESFRQPAVRRAFVVDDEPQVSAFISKALFSAGFTATQFTRIVEIEAALTLVKPELMVLDLSLGETDGVEILRTIAKSRFGGNILLISGHDLTTLE
jgi:diguanylate cyclase (GGDEF)-like protein